MRHSERVRLRQHEGQLVHTLDGFCEVYGISRTTAYEEWKSGRLRTFKVGARRMVAAEDAQRWSEACRAGGDALGRTGGVSTPEAVAARREAAVGRRRVLKSAAGSPVPA